MMNQAMLVGRLTRDPEVVENESGTKYSNLTLAVPRNFKNEDGVYDVSLYNDYRLSKLKEAKDKVEYTIDLTLSKVDDKWYMDDIDSVTESKINGTYQY